MYQQQYHESYATNVVQIVTYIQVAKICQILLAQVVA